MKDEPMNRTLSKADFVSEAFTAYVECLLWSALNWTDDGPSTFDDFDIDSFDADALAALRAEFARVIDHVWVMVRTMDPGQVGHDVWLTREHHGVGFWDRGLGRLGDILTERVQSYGEVNVWVGDDGLLYVDA